MKGAKWNGARKMPLGTAQVPLETDRERKKKMQQHWGITATSLFKRTTEDFLFPRGKNPSKQEQTLIKLLTLLL